MAEENGPDEEYKVELTPPKAEKLQITRKRRSDRMNSILSTNDAAGLPKMFPAKREKKISRCDRKKIIISRKDTTEFVPHFVVPKGRIGGLGQESLLDRMNLRAPKKLEPWRSKNKAHISKAILESFACDKRVFPLITDVDRSLPEVPLLRGCKKES